MFAPQAAAVALSSTPPWPASVSLVFFENGYRVRSDSDIAANVDE
jgi:hypothetical protein